MRVFLLLALFAGSLYAAELLQNGNFLEGWELRRHLCRLPPRGRAAAKGQIEADYAKLKSRRSFKDFLLEWPRFGRQRPVFERDHSRRDCHGD